MTWRWDVDGGFGELGRRRGGAGLLDWLEVALGSERSEEWAWLARELSSCGECGLKETFFLGWDSFLDWEHFLEPEPFLDLEFFLDFEPFLDFGPFLDWDTFLDREAFLDLGLSLDESSLDESSLDELSEEDSFLEDFPLVRAVGDREAPRDRGVD